MTIALGRLGMREFDLASDADLVFVLADEDGAELPFWTRVAERTIELITAYTGYGVIFAVDTRLRPNGRAGPLVQLESGYRDYFSKSAEAWEGITYMKSGRWRATRSGPPSSSSLSRTWTGALRAGRAVAPGAGGDARQAREGAGLREPAQSRTRRLLRHRLRADVPAPAGAGIFYKFLNTPARIDVIEKMGHLEAADAEFLRDAAIFYRAVDHGLRVSTGTPRGICRARLSTGEPHRADRPLDPRSPARPTAGHRTGADPVQDREYFNRLFGA